MTRSDESPEPSTPDGSEPSSLAMALQEWAKGVQAEVDAAKARREPVVDDGAPGRVEIVLPKARRRA